MKKLYRKYFFIPKEGKVSERMMMRRIGLYIATIVVCLGAMSVSAYAFVTWNVTSGVNVLTAAHFDMTVAPMSEARSSDPNGKSYKLTEGEYGFTLGHDGDASTGYCKILIYESDPDNSTDDAKWTYFSKQINDDSDRIIKITVPEGKTVYVRFIAEWGTYSGDDAVTEIILGNDEENTTIETEQADSIEQIQDDNQEDSTDSSQQTETKPVDSVSTEAEAANLQESSAASTE